MIKKANNSLLHSLMIFNARKNIYIFGLSVVLSITMIDRSTDYNLLSQKTIELFVLSTMLGMIFGLLGHKLRQYFFSDEAIVKKFAEEKWTHFTLYKFLILFPIVMAIIIGTRIALSLSLAI